AERPVVAGRRVGGVGAGAGAVAEVVGADVRVGRAGRGGVVEAVVRGLVAGVVALRAGRAGVAGVGAARARGAGVGPVAERPVVTRGAVGLRDRAARGPDARVGGVGVALQALQRARAGDGGGRVAAGPGLAGLARGAGVGVVARGAVRELDEAAVGLPHLAAVARDRIGGGAGVRAV